jgi:hypothetical protein
MIGDYRSAIVEFVKMSLKPAVVDCGSSFDLYGITKMARSAGRNPREILKAVRVVRVFTVFQMKPAVEKVLATSPDLIIICDIERVLEDEGVSEREKAVAFEKAMRVLATAGLPVLFAGKGGPEHGKNLALGNSDNKERIRRVV